MSKILEVANETNWLPFYSFTLEAQLVEGSANKHHPIAEYPIPLIVDKHIIAILVNHDPNPNQWVRGGQLKQRLNASIVAGGVFNTSAVSVHNVTLDEINFIDVPKFSEYYALTYKPPKYFKKVAVSIYKYLPAVLDNVELALAGIEATIDLLNDTLDNLTLGGSL